MKKVQNTERHRAAVSPLSTSISAPKYHPPAMRAPGGRTAPGWDTKKYKHLKELMVPESQDVPKMMDTHQRTQCELS
jgi:hypothetical protein